MFFVLAYLAICQELLHPQHSYFLSLKSLLWYTQRYLFMLEIPFTPVLTLQLEWSSLAISRDTFRRPSTHQGPRDPISAAGV